MNDSILALLFVLEIIICALIVLILIKIKAGSATGLKKSILEEVKNNFEKMERGLRDDFHRNRSESADAARAMREELMGSFKQLENAILKRMGETAGLQKSQLDIFSRNLLGLSQSVSIKTDDIRETIEKRLINFQNDQNTLAKTNRQELQQTLKEVTDSITVQLAETARLQKEEIIQFTDQLGKLRQANEDKLELLKEKVEEKLTALQESNSSKLEEMRKTVDEKLHETLEKRLGDSFKLVSERLEVVHKSLGEMQTLANGVGDLKRVLSNIKTRGTWGEMQLGSLIEQILSPEQFARNVATRKGSSCIVEYAVKMPGNKGVKDEILWLPIDAKFPLEDYQRLLDAQDSVNAVLVEEAAKALEIRIKAEAKDICEKYLDPPNTTDFAILFLPLEGLYAEILRRPGLSDRIQREFRVVLAGPTTLAAILNSLQMGFRTLAIEKRSSEVWSLLGKVKTEFGSFGDILEKTKKKLQEASNTIDTASTASRKIERKLKDVQALPAAGENSQLLP